MVLIIESWCLWFICQKIREHNGKAIAGVAKTLCSRCCPILWITSTFTMCSQKNLQILEQHHVRCSECSRAVSCLSFTSLIQFHEICKQKTAKISFAAASTSWKSGCGSQASAFRSAKLTLFFSVFRGSFGLGEGKHSCKGTWQFLAPKFVCGFCPLLVVRDGKEFVDS